MMRDVTVASRVLLGFAAALWLAAMVLPVTTRGVGSALAGHALADQVSAGRLPDFPRWAGLAWYAMPLGAGVVFASLGANGELGAAVRWAAALTATASASVFIVLLTDLEVNRFGAGAWVAVAGSALAATAVGLAAAPRLRDTRRRDVLH